MRPVVLLLVFFCCFNALSAQTFKEVASIRDSLLQKQNYKISLSYCEQAVSLALAAYGDTSFQYIDAIIKHRKAQSYLSQYKEAAAGYNEIEELLARTKRDTGELGLTYYNARYNAAYAQNQLDEAESWVRKAIQLSEKINGVNHRTTIGCLNNLSNILTSQDKYQEAEQILLKCKAAFDEQGLQKHRFYTSFLLNLGIICYYTGNYMEAEKYYQSALDISKENGDAVRSIDIKYNLFLLYKHYPAKWLERRILLDDILSDYQKTLGINTVPYARALLERGKLCLISNNYSEGLKDLSAAKKIVEDINGIKTNVYFGILGSLANFYLLTNDTQQALQLMNKNLELRAELYSRESVSYYEGVMILGNYYITTNNPNAAETFLQEAKKFYEQKNLTHINNYRRTLRYLQAAYQLQGRYAEAETLIDTLYSTEINAPNANLSTLMHLFDTRINLYQQTSNPVKLAAALEEQGALLNDIARKEMFVLPEKDRLLYHSELTQFNDKQLSFFISNPEKYNVASIYNQILLRKNLSLNTALQVKKQIHSNTDSVSIQQYDQWTGLKERLAHLYTLSPDKLKVYGYNVAQMAKQADSLEQQLSLRSASFKNLQALPGKTWLDVRAALQPDEAIVDIIRFNQSDLLDAKNVRIGYAVFILRHDYAEPKLIFLNDANDLNSYFYEQYSNEIRAGKTPSAEVYQAFWGQIDPALKGVKTLYMAPDGIFHKINLNTLRRADGKFLAEIYNIRILQSMGELLQPTQHTPNTPCSALLVGDPRFDVAGGSGDAATEGMNWRSFLADSTFVLPALPASSREVNEISMFLKDNGCVVETLRDTAATEVKVKAASRPSVLHLATHGHFLQSPKRERMLFDENETADNPMLRSMLFFTGATNTLREQPLPTGIGDGVFTAYEATNLQLEGTELVVLSACNTGLGKIENGEGVFGMQRAFRYAGARYVVMSLWEVEDKASLLFMTTFYRHWLKEKKSIPEAFQQTQTELMKKLTPFQWGAFVLIGR